MGLQLVFSDGQNLLIDTAKPEELQAALLALNKGTD